MKRFLLFTLIFFGFLLQMMQAQSLRFEYKDQLLNDGEKIKITDYTDDPDIGIEMIFDASIKNVTDKNVQVKVVKQEIEIPQGSTNNFCTAQGCFSSSESSVYEIKAKETDHVFHGAFYPTQKSSATIKYIAKNMDALSDETSIQINYSYLTSGIDNIGFTHYRLMQTSASIIIEYQSNTTFTLKIFNLTGALIAEYILPESLHTHTISKKILPKGIYLFQLSNHKKQTYSYKTLIH